MTVIDIYSGFLGAGKTTLIRKMIQEAHRGQKLVLIENEFGQIGIDGGFMRDAGIQVTEMNSGCICCSLVGDFGRALEQVIAEYAPDRIIIEPSGVGKLSDVAAAVAKVTNDQVKLGCQVAVVDASKIKVHSRNFGEFYNDQVQNAGAIILSRTDTVPQAKLDSGMEILRQINSTATIVTTPWGELTGEQLASAMAGTASVAAELRSMEEAHHHHHHHGHHHHHEEGCCCGHDHGEHHHHHDEHCTCGHDHGEHHHHHDEHCTCGHDHEEHHHHHDEHCTCGHDHEEHHHHHDEHCTCGHDHEHHHEHHHAEHDHHADEVFTSWGVETHRKFTKEAIRAALCALETGRYGMVLRAKGIVPCEDGTWLYFDYVPGEQNVRTGSADVTGKLCVIGAKLDEAGVSALFGV